MKHMNYEWEYNDMKRSIKIELDGFGTEVLSDNEFLEFVGNMVSMMFVWGVGQ